MDNGVTVIEIGSNGIKMSIKNDDYSFFSYRPLSVKMHDNKKIDTEDLTEKIWGLVLEASKRKISPENIEIVATGGFRRADNSQQAIDEINKKCGVETRIISPIEEAKLTTRAACDRVRFKGTALIIDSGGASTEIIVAKKEGKKVDNVAMVSIPIGSKIWNETSDIEKSQIIKEYINKLKKKCNWDEIKEQISIVITNSNTVSRIINHMKEGNSENYHYNPIKTTFMYDEKLEKYQDTAKEVLKKKKEDIIAAKYCTEDKFDQFLPSGEIFGSIIDEIGISQAKLKPQIFKPGDGLLIKKYQNNKTRETTSYEEGKIIEKYSDNKQEWHKPINSFYSQQARKQGKTVEISSQAKGGLLIKQGENKIEYSNDNSIKVEKADYQMVYNMLKERQLNANIKNIDLAKVKTRKLQVHFVLAATSLGINILNRPDFTKMNIDEKLINYTEMKQSKSNNKQSDVPKTTQMRILQSNQRA